MTYIQSPFFIANLQLENNIFYSPLAGCSDFAFRKMARLYQPGLIFTEMIKMDSLVRFKPETFQMLAYDASMHPIGAQLCGSNPKMAATSARLLQDLGFDLIDLNCGCPVDKVTKDGSGSGLLKQPELIGEILSNIVASVKIPVTVKIRAGWDDESINCERITQIAELAGAKVIFVHGRTREQGYKGTANRTFIKRAKQMARNIKVFGNGDIFDPVSALDMFEQTQCDGILLSRGTLGNPSLVQNILWFFQTQQIQQTPFEQVIDQLEKHIEMIIAFQPLRKALLDIRRIGCWYAKLHTKMATIRDKFSQVSSTQEVQEILRILRQYRHKDDGNKIHF